MNCPNCDKETLYITRMDGKDEYYCRNCKQIFLVDPDPNLEMEKKEIDGDVLEAAFE